MDNQNLQSVLYHFRAGFASHTDYGGVFFMAELKKRKDGRYQRRITLSNGKTKLVYRRTKAQLSASVRYVQAEYSAGL